MIRDVDINEISDGRLYRSTDLVKTDTGDCSGCSGCCKGMCDTIILDPWDIYHLQLVTGMPFEALMDKYVSLDVFDGLILPHLAFEENTKACLFLNAAGRCSIHAHRPGFCRLFPLGRVYDEKGDFSYFLQVNECPHAKTKVRVKKWLGIDELEKYEAFVRSWHEVLKQARLKAAAGNDPALRKQICMELLQAFYLERWETRMSFFDQYEARLAQKSTV